jgi:hypothetical protein
MTPPYLFMLLKVLIIGTRINKLLCEVYYHNSLKPKCNKLFSRKLKAIKNGSWEEKVTEMGLGALRIGDFSMITIPRTHFIFRTKRQRQVSEK